MDEKKKIVTIIVNGSPKQVEKDDIIYKEVVIFAFGKYDDIETVAYTITYSKGNSEKPKGILVKGESVKTKEGMEFHVTRTDKS